MIHFIIDTMMTREQMEALEIGDGCATCNLCVCGYFEQVAACSKF